MNIDLENLPWSDEAGAYLVGSVGDETVCIVPMIFNHRVTIGPTADHPYSYAHGWCYPDLLSAVAAVRVWDPLSEATPVGYAKQATPGLRPVPEPSR